MGRTKAQLRGLLQNVGMAVNIGSKAWRNKKQPYEELEDPVTSPNVQLLGI
jgi:hypothetical protein